MLGLRIDTIYYDLIDKQAKLVFRATEILRMAVLDSERIEMYIAKIDAVQNEMAEVSQDLINRVANAFVTPYDKEDLHTISRQTLQICEMIYIQTLLFDQLKIAEYTEILARFTEYLVELAGNLKEGLNYLRTKNTRENLIDHLRSFRRLKLDTFSSYTQLAGNIIVSTETRTKIKLRFLPILHSFKELVHQMDTLADSLEKMSIKYA